MGRPNKLVWLRIFGTGWVQWIIGLWYYVQDPIFWVIFRLGLFLTSLAASLIHGFFVGFCCHGCSLIRLLWHFKMGKGCGLGAPWRRHSSLTAVSVIVLSCYAFGKAICSWLILICNAYRLDKRASILDFRLDCQDLERFSVINRFARFHGRGQVDGAETSSSTDATTTVQKPCPQRYVSAHPMPRNVPERVQCLSLWSSLIYWFSSRIGSIVSTSPNFA